MELLSQRFSRLIQEHGFKITEFSTLIGVSQPTVSRILSGKQIPTADTLYKASKQLGISMEYLLTGTNEIYDHASSDTYLTADEALLLKKYKALSSDDKEEISMLLDIKYQRAFPQNAPGRSTCSDGKKRTVNNTETA